jgi:hypothetical protein
MSRKPDRFYQRERTKIAIDLSRSVYSPRLRFAGRPSLSLREAAGKKIIFIELGFKHMTKHVISNLYYEVSANG